MKSYYLTVNVSKRFEPAQYRELALINAKSKKEAKQKALRREFEETYVLDEHINYRDIERAKFVIVK